MLKKLFLSILYVLMPVTVLPAASSSGVSGSKIDSGIAGFDRSHEYFKSIDESLRAEKADPGYLDGLRSRKKFLDALKSAPHTHAEFFMKACVYGTMNIISCLLMLPNVDVNQVFKDTLGERPLYIACRCGYEDMVAMLLKYGAKPNIKNDRGSTPLIVAAHNGFTKVVDLLIKGGADVNFCTNSNLSALHYAVNAGHKEIVELLLAANADPKACDDNNLAPLSFAVQTGNIALVELLIQAGADIDAVSKAERWPLAVAVYFGYTDIVRLLIGLGAKINPMPNGKFTLLHVLALSESVISSDIFELLKAQKDILSELNVPDASENYPMHYIWSRGNKTDVLQFFLSLGLNPNVTNRYQETPLYSAAYAGNLDAVRILCEHHADIHAKNILGLSPIDAARMSGHKHIERFLRNYPAISRANSPSSSSSSSSSSQEIQDSVASSASSSTTSEDAASEVCVPKPVTYKGKGKSRNRRVALAELFVVNDHTRQDDDQVFALRQLAQNMTVVVHKQPKQVIPRVTNLRNMSGKDDKFHQFSSEVDRYLDRGIYIKASECNAYAALLDEYDIRELRGFAVLLPGRIEGMHYDARYAKLDINRQTQGFDGAFIYLFDAQGRCYHRCFHQNKKYKNYEASYLKFE